VTEALSLTRFAIGLAFLIFASAQDLKRRRVDDLVWIILGSLGILLIVVQLIMDNSRWEYYLVLIPVLILFFDIFWDREPLYEDGKFKFVPLPIIFYILAIVAMILLFLNYSSDEYFLRLFTVPVMILVCYALYYSRIIRGGADAKALICISMLMPLYPVLYGFPLISMEPRVLEVTSILFPFALLVLLNASILFLFSPLVFLIYNVKRRSVEFPQCLFGYRVDVRKVPRFTWLMQRLENEKVKLSLFPKKNENKREVVRELREFGLEEVWVTPQIPFIVPLCLGFVMSFVVGNVFFGLILLFT
jgi:preflagellin peptidase FlaK